MKRCMIQKTIVYWMLVELAVCFVSVWPVLSHSIFHTVLLRTAVYSHVTKLQHKGNMLPFVCSTYHTYQILHDPHSQHSNFLENTQ